MNNMKIGVRLGLGFALVLALMALLTCIGLWRLQAVAQATHDMTQLPLTKERYISDWYRYIDSGVRRTTAISKSTDPTLGAFFAEDSKISTRAAAELQQKIEPLLETDEEKALWQELQKYRKIFISSRDASWKAKDAGQLDEANRILEQTYIPASKTYLGLVQKLLEMQRKSIDATARGIDTTYEESRNLLIALGAFVLALGALCAWWLTIGITRPLNKAVDLARTVTSGDLSSNIEVTGKDEASQLLQALKDMNQSLVRIVTEVRAGTETIATASNQIAAGNLDLSSRTEQQASSLEETASSMEELTSTVKQNADNARQANGLAMSASEVAIRGGTVVSQVVDTMGSINESAKKIVDIIGVIDGIAFQTNILALNAAVEAARAGEQGRGFAVVASEVRNLAQRSAGAAKEIKALIGDSVEKVDAGAKLVDQAGHTMAEIVGSIKRVTDMMGEITAASQEQTSGIEQINQAITQMDQVTQQNASLVEEAAAASEAMQEQANKLTQVVGAFKLDGRQAAVTAQAAREPRRPHVKARAIPLSPKTSTKPGISLAAPRPKRSAGVPAAARDEWEQF
jgi:methyl-accepting chemotaxis protein